MSHSTVPMWAAPGFGVLGPVLLIPSGCLHLFLEKEDMIATFFFLHILGEVPGLIAHSALPDLPLVVPQSRRKLRLGGYDEEGVYGV